MAIHSRRKVEENEEESVFISMTDLMISILFIIMILMAYFSTRIDPNIQVVEKSKYEKVLLELEAAEELIGTLNNEIDQQKVEILDLKVKISDLEIIILKLKKELENINFEPNLIDFSNDFTEKSSVTIKYGNTKSISLGEFQIHSARNSLKFRFNFLSLLNLK